MDYNFTSKDEVHMHLYNAEQRCTYFSNHSSIKWNTWKKSKLTCKYDILDSKKVCHHDIPSIGGSRDPGRPELCNELNALKTVKCADSYNYVQF
jgi:hypothetical protein